MGSVAAGQRWEGMSLAPDRTLQFSGLVAALSLHSSSLSHSFFSFTVGLQEMETLGLGLVFRVQLVTSLCRLMYLSLRLSLRVCGMVGAYRGRVIMDLMAVERVSDVGIHGLMQVKSTIRNIMVINVVCSGADEQALNSNPLCILLIAQYVTITTILLLFLCLCSGAACSLDSNDTI